MRFVNTAIIALAALATLGGYFQEKKRLGTILALPAAAARDLYEKLGFSEETIRCIKRL